MPTTFHTEFFSRAKSLLSSGSAGLDLDKRSSSRDLSFIPAVCVCVCVCALVCACVCLCVRAWVCFCVCEGCSYVIQLFVSLPGLVFTAFIDRHFKKRDEPVQSHLLLSHTHINSTHLQACTLTNTQYTHTPISSSLAP